MTLSVYSTSSKDLKSDALITLIWHEDALLCLETAISKKECGLRVLYLRKVLYFA